MHYGEIKDRANTIKRYSGLQKSILSNQMPQFQNVSVSEALVLGLLNQGVRKYIGIFGHGSTDVANILSVYEDAGLLKMYNVRHEVEAAHCASMLRWHYGETAAVITSIGPGALHAFAGSLASVSNGIGVYHIYGDGTTHDEGPNMQQIPKDEQGGFSDLVKAMNAGYQVHTPRAIFTALRRGAATVFDPGFAGPFYFLLPMNIQPAIIRDCNLSELPARPEFPQTVTEDKWVFQRVTDLVKEAGAITIKFGGGAEDCGPEIVELADLLDAVIVAGAKMSGVVPYSHKRYMTVGGSKGSISGNYAMNNADLVVVIGARAVCQWDCSGTAWKNAKHIINFNTNHGQASHYNRSVSILGHAKHNLRKWIERLKKDGYHPDTSESKWLTVNMENRKKWEEFKQKRYDAPVLYDEGWGKEVLTQPAAIKIAYDFANERNAARYFDAGDVQANGFQVVEDEEYGLTYNETGSSYMGFAVSALLANGIADNPVYTFAFSGDGSFTMNPQILFDGVEHGVRGCIIIFDNRSMAAITGLQYAQYEREYKTRDAVETDYVAMARAVKGARGIFGGFTSEDFKKALEQAYGYSGLSVIHLPVYMGQDELGGLGVFGSWNVGNWCDEVQKEHHKIGL